MKQLAETLCYLKISDKDLMKKVIHNDDNYEHVLGSPFNIQT